jgi:hypothetical protein
MPGELPSKRGDFFVSRRPICVACITVENQRTGFQRGFKFLLAERHSLIVVVRAFNFEVYSVAHKLPFAEIFRADISAVLASAFFSRRGKRVLFCAGILPTPFLIRVVTDDGAATFPAASPSATGISLWRDSSATVFSGFFIRSGQQSDSQRGVEVRFSPWKSYPLGLELIPSGNCALRRQTSPSLRLPFSLVQ